MYLLIKWLISALRRRAALAQAPAEGPTATAPDHDEPTVRPAGSGLAAPLRPAAPLRLISGTR
jgi:hypothetical protein